MDADRTAEHPGAQRSRNSIHGEGRTLPSSAMVCSADGAARAAEQVEDRGRPPPTCPGHQLRRNDVGTREGSVQDPTEPRIVVSSARRRLCARSAHQAVCAGQVDAPERPHRAPARTIRHSTTASSGSVRTRSTARRGPGRRHENDRVVTSSTTRRAPCACPGVGWTLHEPDASDSRRVGADGVTVRGGRRAAKGARRSEAAFSRRSRSTSAPGRA